ncbi:MAG: 50S ribosomal protein L4 [Candidatus Pacearchaeota archaeon]
MKAQLLSIDGKKIKEIQLPGIFDTKIREDILKKVFEAEKNWTPYGPNKESGKRHSASGTIRHKRHAWKAHYGRGISRIPRKKIWRRGTQFYWVGAEISSARGGRRAHPPKPESIQIKKINKKEYKIALNSAIAATANSEKIKAKYYRLKNTEINNLPIIVESKISELKTNDLVKTINLVLGNLNPIIEIKKSVRAGKGKLRNRKYKKPAGVLIVTGNEENIKSKIFNHVKVKDIIVNDLYPEGRIVIYTENAVKDLEKLWKIEGSKQE